MKDTLKTVAPLLTLVTCTLMLFGTSSQVQAADASGAWTWSRAGRDGGEARTTTLTLKADGEKLTGTLTSPGRQGGEPVKTEISDGKVTADEISFSVVREFNGNKRTTKYIGTVSADTIKGKMESERNGEVRSRDWEAKREAAK